ncbi:MAG TPA: helix-turn-helix domain-containing protein [Nevskiaceae bacterium]|nr:helix-turn-helix domain-containing protein [Nevskiaceae bacterium]
MATIAEVLKQQIADLTDKAIKKHVADLRAMAAQQDRTIARLKSQVSALEQQLAGARRSGSARRKAAPTSADGRSSMRFQAKGLVSLRARLGLSRAKFGKLVGVSGISVYNWERRRAKPRPALLLQIAELRHLGKKEAQARLRAAGVRRSNTMRKNPPIGGRQK